MTNIATTISVAEDANAPLAGNNRACSDGRSGEDKHGSGERARSRTGYGGFSETRPLCYGSRQGKKLLCLQGFQVYGPQLQE